MNDGLSKSLIISMLFVTVTMMVGITFVQQNISYGQAVDLIPIQTGNTTLDNGLPEFYVQYRRRQPSSLMHPLF